jgi:hypothetical protein
LYYQPIFKFYFRECQELIDDIRQLSAQYESADGWIRHFDWQVEEALRAALLKKQEEEQEQERVRREQEEEEKRRQKDLMEQKPVRRRIRRAVRIICFDCHRSVEPIEIIDILEKVLYM